MDANAILALVRMDCRRALTVIKDPGAVQTFEGILWLIEEVGKPQVATGDNIVSLKAA